jgi:hypothetical protein
VNYKIANKTFLRRILWVDFICGFVTGVLGLLFLDNWSEILGLSFTVVFWVSLITLSYALVAFSLALPKEVNVFCVRMLIKANWAWTGISIILIYLHFDNASSLGKGFLLTQLSAVALLAYIEGKQLKLG